tara:strand:- start:2312 stop:3301 length:990 start_codon:yes stop_codon:yes gene_type:complete
MTKLISTIALASIVFIGCAEKPEERQIIKKDKTLSIQLEATAYPHKTRAISSTSGKVFTIDNHIGNLVKKNDPIFSIDRSLIEKEISVLNKQISNAKRNMNQYRNNYGGSNPTAIQLTRMNLEKVASLYSKGYASEQQFNQAKLNYSNALYLQNENNRTSNTNSYNQNRDISDKELELYRLKERLNNSTVKASMDGYIFKLDLFEGKILTDGQKIGEIVDISKVKVRAGLASGLLPFVKKGRTAKITFLTTPPFERTVPINKIIPVMDAEFGRVTIDFDVDNKDFLIQPGTKAIVHLALKENEQEKVKDMFLFDEKKNKSNLIEVSAKN